MWCTSKTNGKPWSPPGGLCCCILVLACHWWCPNGRCPRTNTRLVGCHNYLPFFRSWGLPKRRPPRGWREDTPVRCTVPRRALLTVDCVGRMSHQARSQQSIHVLWGELPRERFWYARGVPGRTRRSPCSLRIARSYDKCGRYRRHRGRGRCICICWAHPISHSVCGFFRERPR